MFGKTGTRDTGRGKASQGHRAAHDTVAVKPERTRLAKDAVTQQRTPSRTGRSAQVGASCD